MDNLVKLNNLKSKTLQIGQKLSVPQTVTEEEENTYIVKSGDSLYSIATKFNTTVDKIKNLNNLLSNILSVGQKLKIPYDINEEEEIYTVSKGDSLYSIANKFNTTVDAIKSLNNLTSNTLSIGQELKLPISNQNITNPNTYIVQSGDTLYSIAKKFNTTIQEIISLNNLTSTSLSLNQQLKVPSTSNTYVVQSGDSLWSISKKLNTTVDELKNKNNLTSNTLSIGQKLIY